ncbi:MAG: hypothetical protein SPL58_07520 [Bacteroidaceae bacterium]|nr:hypothetical protein [Bacteroidaceae bacterium]
MISCIVLRLGGRCRGRGTGDALAVAQEMLLQLKQVILVEKIELDAATMALNKKYEAYLEECKNSIEI